MDTGALADKDKQIGEEIIRVLDDKDIPVRTAFWRFDEDAGEWRLVIVTPIAQSKGSKIAYEVIQKAILGREATKDFPIWRIEALGPDDPRANVRDVVKTSETEITHIDAPSTTAGNILIGDIVVYRSS